ncbi:alpha/beta fold hydrolase [Actinoplanes awajinensis]|uniref:Alpha/beta hydrolase n=1 Tax=Actinoplanes awajinensis subsp. mycoplanecinus TaxID=135947 RepID=A0A101JDG5_9ACTN|nr:alpha/beta hydrolase [Actinoplanes awajinensis]KUL24799.1 alpha/beta hydrolase [Actinoplanes awajinensis subsp. mycoplanecinus]
MTLAFEVTGAGPDVLLLHSTVCDRRMWDPQVPDLVAAGFRVTRCDFRGFGDSPIPDRPWNDADEIVELLGGRPFAVVGASGGGQLGLEIAARWPERVTALALLCTALPGHPKSPQRLAFAGEEDALVTAGDLDAATELNVRTWVGPAAGPEQREAVRVMQRRVFELQPPDMPEPEQIEVEWELDTIVARTLLLSGAYDLPDFREIAVHLAGVLPDARHVELDWAGHLPSLERPELVNPLLIDFLRAV